MTKNFKVGGNKMNMEFICTDSIITYEGMGDGYVLYNNGNGDFIDNECNCHGVGRGIGHCEEDYDHSGYGDGTFVNNGSDYYEEDTGYGGGEFCGHGEEDGSGHGDDQNL